MIDEIKLNEILNGLEQANELYTSFFRGESTQRQPVHTVYGGAHLFKASLPTRLGELALKSLERYGDNFISFARALHFEGWQSFPTSLEKVHELEDIGKKDVNLLKKINPHLWLAFIVYERIKNKLQDEPVEDFRIDFEDGFGNRPDEEEDKWAKEAARQVAEGMKAKSLPPFIGIRIKPLNEELKHRSLRTLQLFLSELVSLTGAGVGGGGKFPNNFVITLPKVPIPEQVTALVEVLDLLEQKLQLEKGILKIELMIELTQTLFDVNGASNIPLLLRAAKGRCRGAHFGTYDYTASCNITAAHQTMIHPTCDFARMIMLNTLSNTGVMMSDGATNVMPIGPHRAKDRELNEFEINENREVVHSAWRLAFNHIMYSLEIGFYQGWDLHPAQLPIRYAAMYNFFLKGLSSASERLTNFIGKAAQATLVGDVFDDAATGQGLLNYFLRALSCGAISEEDVIKTGLSLEEVQSRSFVKIVDARNKK